MDRSFKKLGITVKKKTLHPQKKETEGVQQQRVDFWQEIAGIEAKDLVFLDEAGVNLGLIRTHARCERGRRAYSSQPNRRGQNVSVVGAVGLDGMVSAYSILGGFDGLTFEAFVVRKLVPNLWEGACVVMDNCPAHKGEMIRKAMEKKGAKLVYLPPYSPDFSPIENRWSKLKDILKKIGARTYEDLVDAIDIAFASIELKDIHNWFTHCCYCSS